MHRGKRIIASDDDPKGSRFFRRFADGRHGVFASTIVRTRLRRLIAVLSMGAFGAGLHAETAGPASPAAAVPEPPVQAWLLTSSLRTAAGYKDNVLLSPHYRKSSGLSRTEAEVFLWRMPTGNFEALAFVNGTMTRYFNSEENPREWQAFAHAEARWTPLSALRATLTTEGYYMDQVFDLSSEDEELSTAKLRVTGGIASAVLHWEFLPRTWVELKPGVQRDCYRDGSDSNRQRLGRATLGHSCLDGRLEVAFAGQAMRRDYDRRTQYTTAGRSRTGTRLSFDQKEGEGKIGIVWSKDRAWRTTTTAGVLTNRDNGSGYFDYNMRRLRQEVAWMRAPWTVRAIGRVGRFDYKVQTVGIGINPPPRVKEDFAMETRIERRWGKELTVYAGHVWERSRSNDSLSSYQVNTVLAGVECSF